MLLNPSHKITFSGLPPDVLDAYVRYKKGTRALVAWFIQFSDAPERNVKRVPLKELAGLAENASKSLASIPEVVHFHFRETIAARSLLSKHFRKNIDEELDDVDTINHEHFTTSLSSIYARLCSCCAQTSRHKRHSQRGKGRSRAPGISEPTNHYAHLSVDDPESDSDTESNASITTFSSSCSECEATLSTCESDPGPCLVDDDLHTAVEMTLAVQTRSERTRHGASTQILLDHFEEVEQMVSDLFKGDHVAIGSCPACIQKPSAYINESSTADEVESVFSRALLDNILHLIANTTAPPAIVRNSTPVYADLGYLMTHRSDQSHFPAVLGVHLLTTTYKAYLTCLDPPMSPTCRLSALRLAQEVRDSVANILADKTCFPCRCTETLAFHLQNLQSDLEAFTRQKVWNLYFQSPWVSGMHMVEILDLAHYYGLRLFRYRHYVGAVLHTYNVLTTLGFMKQILVLDALIDVFPDLIFPGHGGRRPTSNFKPVWGRYVGARLKFKKGHKARNSKDSWCMAIPPHAARRAAGLEAGGAADKCECLLFKIKGADYRISDDIWETVRGERPSDSNSTRRLSGNAHSDFDEQDLVSLAQNLQSTYRLEGSSSLPVARVDLIGLFASFVRVVANLSDATHTSREEKGLNCICFASVILGGGDRIVETRRMGRLATWSKGEKECVTLAKEVLEKEFGEMPLRKACWEC